MVLVLVKNSNLVNGIAPLPPTVLKFEDSRHPYGISTLRLLAIIKRSAGAQISTVLPYYKLAELWNHAGP